MLLDNKQMAKQELTISLIQQKIRHLFETQDKTRSFSKTFYFIDQILSTFSSVMC